MMLQRNLLYTAVTRAKKLVVLVGSAKALGQAVVPPAQNTGTPGSPTLRRPGQLRGPVSSGNDRRPA